MGRFVLTRRLPSEPCRKSWRRSNSVRCWLLKRWLVRSEDVAFGHHSCSHNPLGHIIFDMKHLPIESSRLAAFCEANGIRKLSLFGSQLHGTARPDSDIDLLVEFYPDRIPGLFKIAEMEFELSDMLGGKKVDLRTAEDLSRYFRQTVLQEAAEQYAQ